MKRPFLLVIGMVMSAGATYAAPLDDLLRQVQCERPLDPVPVIRGLFADGTITSPDYDGYDSVSCWVAAKGTNINGASVLHICASVSDMETIEANDDLFWRGPGTAPPTSLSFTTDSDVRLAKMAKAADIRPHPIFPGETELYCHSEW